MHTVKQLEKRKEHVTLLSFLYDNVDLLHPELLTVLNPVLQQYKGLVASASEFFETIEHVDATWRGNSQLTQGILNNVTLAKHVDFGDSRDCSIILCTERDIRYGVNRLTLDAYTFYLLMSVCFDIKLFAPLIYYFTNSRRKEQYATILAINEINQALKNGLDAWKDAVYLYYYRKLCFMRYKAETKEDYGFRTAETTLVTFEKMHYAPHKGYECPDRPLELSVLDFRTPMAAGVFIDQLDHIIKRGKELEKEYIESKTIN